jgi:hypothetical protein
VLFAFAAAPNETASDGSEANSPFTSALVRHFGTAGVELRTALTLVQQDVYDRSRGKLPYIESGLPELVFITGQGVLPERDQLLMAMADLTPDLRAEVEALAAERNMPLAPLYAALLSADLEQQTAEDRARLLEEAAVPIEQFQSELQRFQSERPPRCRSARPSRRTAFAWRFRYRPRHSDGSRRDRLLCPHLDAGNLHLTHGFRSGDPSSERQRRAHRPAL